jgi:SAM-dependent methyltransferase
MSYNKQTPYDLEQYIAEIYDQTESYTDDIDLLRSLIGKKTQLRVLEPFCGTGRLAIPLAIDGHFVVGIDKFKGMIDRFQLKLQQLSKEISNKIDIIEADVIDTPWPIGFDLAVLGANCFYELATAAEQEHCIRSAACSLRKTGYVFVDNDHMEGILDESWRDTGIVSRSLEGTASFVSKVQTTRETVWFEAEQRLARFRRRVTVTKPNGEILEEEFIQQKHPVSAAEVSEWLRKYGFTIEKQLGDRQGLPYTQESERAIFWAHV